MRYRTIGNIWTDALTPVRDTFLRISEARWAVPPPNTYIERAGDREVITTGPRSGYPPVGITAPGSGNLLTIGLIAVAALAVLSFRK